MIEPLTQAALRSVLRLEDDGHLYWIKRTSNRIHVGDRAGSLGFNGYWVIRIFGKLHYEHQLVWFWHHGVMPRRLDHADVNSWNNKIVNLREATASQNGANQRIAIDNTSGHKGVSWNKRLSKWHAYICVNRKRIHLGFHEKIEDAAAAYAAAASEHFKEFARPSSWLPQGDHHV